MCAICHAARRGDHADVIVVARRRLGLTQSELGQRIGLSHSEISRLEAGKRALRDVTLLRRFAEALELPGAVFGLKAPQGRRVCDEPSEGGLDPVERRELLTALVTLAASAALRSSATHSGPTTPPTVAALRADLAHTRAAFDACHYASVGRSLPTLAANAHQTLAAAPSGQQTDEAESVLADIYSLAAFTADKTDEFGVAWVLADRARTHAAASGNPVSIAAATRETAVAMRRAGHHGQAVDLLTNTAADLDGGDWALAGRGSLLLTAAYTHAQFGNDATALSLADEASEVATRLPSRWPTNGLFTPTQVPIYRIGVHNALGDPARALTVARGVALGTLPTAERRARVCVDVARAWFAYGDPERCLRALRLAEWHAPEEVRRPRIQGLTRDLLDLPGREPDGLRSFAAATGAAL